MNVKKPNRKRNKAVTIRMNPEEYSFLQNKVDDSGLSQQTFIINAIKGATIKPSDEVAVLKDYNKTFSDLVRQLRGLATNVNQIARIANCQGCLPTSDEFVRLLEEISKYRKESEDLWLLIRSSINQQNPTEP